MSTHPISHPITHRIPTAPVQASSAQPDDAPAGEGTAPGETGTATATSAAVSPSPGWRRLSAALTDEAALIADRDALLAPAPPGAGRGAPPCLLVNEATIEIDGVPPGPPAPATLHPDDPADRTRYGTAWG